MAELSGRKAIAEHLGVPCGEVSRLLRRRLPIRFEGQRKVADTGAIDAWKREHGDQIPPEGPRTV